MNAGFPFPPPILRVCHDVQWLSLKRTKQSIIGVGQTINSSANDRHEVLFSSAILVVIIGYVYSDVASYTEFHTDKEIQVVAAGSIHDLRREERTVRVPRKVLSTHCD